MLSDASNHIRPDASNSLRMMCCLGMSDSLRIIYGMRMVLPAKRVLQVVEDELVSDYACMARKA